MQVQVSVKVLIEIDADLNRRLAVGDEQAFGELKQALTEKLGAHEVIIEDVEEA